MARTERGPSTSDSDSGQHLRTQISLQPNAKMKLRPSSRTNFKVSYFHSLIHETYYPFRILPSVLYFLKSRSIKQEIHRGSHSPKVTLYFLKYTKISWMFRDFFLHFQISRPQSSQSRQMQQRRLSPRELSPKKKLSEKSESGDCPSGE